jgi:hypothetical protein
MLQMQIFVLNPLIARRARAWLLGPLLLLAPMVPLEAEEASLEAVLAELSALRTEVAALRARVDLLETNTARVESRIEEAAQAGPQPSAVRPEDPNFLDRLTDQLLYRDELAGDIPWLRPEPWTALRKGMTSEEVIALLGEPTYDEPSLNRRIDRVFTYRGRNSDTNQRVVGKVRFENDKVVNFELPEFR